MGVKMSHLQKERKKAARMGPPIMKTIQTKMVIKKMKALMASLRSADVMSFYSPY